MAAQRLSRSLPGGLPSNSLPARMADVTVTGNLIEAGLWLGLACIAAGLAARASGQKRRWGWIMVAALVAFGASDVVESKTGAWWRPFWLLLLKGACLVVLVYGALRLRALAKAERRRSNARVGAEPSPPDRSASPDDAHKPLSQ